MLFPRTARRASLSFETRSLSQQFLAKGNSAFDSNLFFLPNQVRGQGSYRKRSHPSSYSQRRVVFPLFSVLRASAQHSSSYQFTVYSASLCYLPLRTQSACSYLWEFIAATAASERGNLIQCGAFSFYFESGFRPL